MAFSYEKQPFVDVDNTHGPAVTKLAHKVVLNSNNFDFGQVRSDLYDVQFADKQGQVLPHYLYFYGAEREFAVFFVQIELLAGEIKPISLWWGDSTRVIDPSDKAVCLYANRCATAADFAEFTESFGPSVASLQVDVAAPHGGKIHFSTATGNSGLLLDLSLPECYEAWMMEASIGASAGYPGPLVECIDNNDYYRIGKSASPGGATQVARLLGGVQNNVTTLAATGEWPAAGEWVMQQTLVGPQFQFVEIDSLPVNNGVQGLAYHVDIGLVYSTSDSLYRISLSGIEQESLTPSIAGSSFGDCQIVDINDGMGLQCYITRFDGATPTSMIYRFNPNDLASGLTLVADITASIPTTHSINAIAYDSRRGRWFVGVTNSAYQRCDFFEFSKDFVTFYGRVDAHEGDWGFQGSDFSRGMLFASEHSAALPNQNRTWWQGYAIDETARIAHPSHALYPLSNDGQGIAYAADQDLWYVLDRSKTPDAINVLRLDVDRSQRQITGRWGYNDKSVGSTVRINETPPAPQAKVGLGTYRTVDVANLAFIKTVFPLPINRLPQSSNSAVAPVSSEVLSVGDTQHAITVA